MRRMRGVWGGMRMRVGMGVPCGWGKWRPLLEMDEGRQQSCVGFVQRRDPMLLSLDDALLVGQRGGHLALFTPQLVLHTDQPGHVKKLFANFLTLRNRFNVA